MFSQFMLMDRILPRLLMGASLAALVLFAGAPSSLAAPPAAPAKPATAKPAADKAATESKPAEKPAPEPVIENVVNVTAEQLVDKPQDFMGKNVRFTANFFAFSNLALDYKPAYRSPKTHLSFLVLRPNSHIPLSELKLAMMIPKDKDPETQLLTTLKDGDQLEMVGKVFSTALDEPWVEVLKLKKIGGTDDKKAQDDSKASADAKSGDGKSGGAEPGKTPTEK